MTTKDLIEKLQKLDPDFEVWRMNDDGLIDKYDEEPKHVFITSLKQEVVVL